MLNFSHDRIYKLNFSKIILKLVIIEIDFLSKKSILSVFASSTIFQLNPV